MDNAITKEMFVRTLTESEYAAVTSKNVKEIKAITGIDRGFMVGDSMVAFADTPIEKGLYKFDWKAGKTGQGYRGLTYWTPNVNIFRDPPIY